MPCVEADGRTRIVVLAGGIGAARFLRGLLARLAEDDPTAEVTVIGNTADDIVLHGLHVSPDLDTVMYTLGGGIHPGQGWGRAEETHEVAAELAAYGVESWFVLGDRDIATHLVRTEMLAGGATLSAVTEALCARWRPGVRLLPMSDDPVQTHVTIADPGAPDGTRTVHFQEYWVRLRAAMPALAVVPVGADKASPAPDVLESIAAADVLLLPPSNPVVSIGTILAVPGIVAAIAANTRAPVVGLSPIVGDAPVRGMADKMLAAIGVPTSAAAVAVHYGADLLDGWLVDTRDAAAVEPVRAAGIRARAVPLLMRDLAATSAMAAAALAMAAEIKGAAT
jgi:LPPG:FO 2-phospho-L-lactate transferase